MYNETNAYEEQKQYAQQRYYGANAPAPVGSYNAPYNNNANVNSQINVNNNYDPPPHAQQQQTSYNAGDPSAPYHAYPDPYNAPPAMANDQHMPAPAPPLPHGQPAPFGTNYGYSNINNIQPDHPEPEAVAPAPNAVDSNGLRWTWSAYPNTPLTKVKEHTSVASVPLPPMIVPLACMYTPLTPLNSSAQLILGDPDAPGQRCTQCGAYWCIHCQRDEAQNLWICMACLHHNRLPMPYIAQHPTLRYETVEYVLPRESMRHHTAAATTSAAAAVSSGATTTTSSHTASPPVSQPVYIFVVDTCLPDEEFDMLRNALLRCVQWLPEHTLVGLISFSARACVWELGTGSMSVCHVLRGDAPGAAIAEMLKITTNQNVLGRFIAPLRDCIFTLTTLLEELQADTPPLPPNARALRTTGTAIEAAAVLIEYIGQSPMATIAAQSSAVTAAMPSHPIHHGATPSHVGYDGKTKITTTTMHYHGRVVLFTGGPCTRGPGAVVSIDKSQIMRSHRDIIEDNIPLYSAAVGYYDSLAARLDRANTCLDVFAQSFDQVGIMEMRNCVNQTGGTMICGDAFTHENFISTLERYFAYCGISFNANPDNDNDESADNRNSKEERGLVEGPGNQMESNSGHNDRAANTDSTSTMNCGYNVRMQIYTSFDTLVRGVIGPCTSNENESSSSHKQSQTKVQQSRFNNIIRGKSEGHDTTMSGTQNTDSKSGDGATNSHCVRGVSCMGIGVGNTTSWRVSAMNETTTFSYVFDTATVESAQISEELPNSQQRYQSTYGSYQPPVSKSACQLQRHSQRFVQFVTRYIASETQDIRVRITSVSLPIPSVNIEPAFYVRHRTFDATCASTVIARMAMSILESFPNKWDEVKRWIDTLLVNFVRRYGTYTLNQPESLKLDASCALFPSFIFNLRRSEYFMVLNISPDETTFKRHWLMREPVDNCVRMIQPTLDSYDYDNPYATAVPLDSSSLRDDNIVLMDAFFNVHIMWGQVLFEWIKAGYQDQPEHAYFAELLENVEADAQSILSARYPSPRFSRTDANGSEARHIKTRVNPTTTHKNSDTKNCSSIATADLIYTDDADSTTFMRSLQRMVVTPEEVKEKKANILKTIL